MRQNHTPTRQAEGFAVESYTFTLCLVSIVAGTEALWHKREDYIGFQVPANCKCFPCIEICEIYCNYRSRLHLKGKLPFLQEYFYIILNTVENQLVSTCPAPVKWTWRRKAANPLAALRAALRKPAVSLLQPDGICANSGHWLVALTVRGWASGMKWARNSEWLLGWSLHLREYCPQPWERSHRKYSVCHECIAAGGGDAHL